MSPFKGKLSQTVLVAHTQRDAMLEAAALL